MSKTDVNDMLTPYVASPGAAPVCVTGASGYIASWIVTYLLQLGYTVHATVRNPNKAESVAHLKRAADGQPGQLKLFAADLLDPGSFDAAVQGCAQVIHTASPFIIKGFKDAHEALVRPAVEGTEAVLLACNRADSVRRVVVTSSVASVFGDNAEIDTLPYKTFTEAQWNNTSNERHQPYSYSKVAAERRAWELAKQQNRWSMVTINPSLVMGPSLTRLTQSTSMDVMRDLGSGKQRTGVPHLEFGLVDVRDVAVAHLLAAFNPKAEGRFILTAEVASLLKMAAILRTRFPKYPLPTLELPKWLVRWVAPVAAGVSRKFIDLNVGYKVAFSTERSKQQLGLKYRPLNETLCEHFSQMIEDGLLRRRD